MAQGEAPDTANLIGYLGRATQWGREIWAPGERNGAIPVNIQDQHTPAFDAPFSQIVGSPMTLASDSIMDSYSVEMTTGHTLVATDQVLLQDIDDGRAMYAAVVSVSGPNTVNLDTPVNFRYHANHTRVLEIVSDLNVNGAITRQSFLVGTSVEGIEIDITRILFQITTTDVPEFSEFGDIAGGLARGVVCRVVNGGRTNLFNFKTNAAMALLMYDVAVYEQTKAFGVNGIAGRLTYAGQSKHGVTIRLAQNEILEVIIQDDLTSLLSFHMSASGHVVTD